MLQYTLLEFKLCVQSDYISPATNSGSWSVLHKSIIYIHLARSYLHIYIECRVLVMWVVSYFCFSLYFYRSWTQDETLVLRVLCPNSGGHSWGWSWGSTGNLWRFSTLTPWTTRDSPTDSTRGPADWWVRYINHLSPLI